mgnify:CR=1 FL=1
MTRLRIILWILMLILGFLWDFLPILPWPFLSYLAIIFLQIADKNYFTIGQIIILWIIMAIVTVIDVITPIIWTKKMWWTKRWTRWSTIWLIVWVIILPIFWIVLWPFGLLWLLGWPFLWAYIGEILYQKKYDVILSEAKNLKKTKKDYSQSSSEWQTLNHKKALKAAFWSFLWFLWWILLKVTYTIIIAIYFFPAMIQIFK